MSALSDWLEARIMDFVFKNNSLAWTSPGNSLYVAAFTAGAGLEAGSLADEVSGAGTAYARQQVVAASWTRTNNVVVNAADINFPVATAAWGTVTHGAVIDSATLGAGNILWHGALAASKTIDTDDQFRILAGDLEAAIN
jgi:hypothetical protein